MSGALPWSSAGARTLVIVNPAAGYGRALRRWPSIARALVAAGVRFDTVVTDGPGDATAYARRALRSGFETIVAVGGDGTANEVVNGFFDGEEPIAPRGRFGLIPAGSGGDLARTLGLRGDAPYRALGPDGRTGVIDLVRVRYTAFDGRPGMRYFANSGDLGIGGETVAALRTGTKRLGGFIAYLVAAVRAILHHRARTLTYWIDDGPPTSELVDTIFVTNGRFIGGGMRLAPAAVIDDGILDGLVLRRVSRIELLLRLLPAIYRGAHLRHPAVKYFRARRIRVEADEPVLLQIDGEQPGMAPAEFEIVPAALRIALPPAEATPAR